MRGRLSVAHPGAAAHRARDPVLRRVLLVGHPLHGRRRPVHPGRGLQPAAAAPTVSTGPAGGANRTADPPAPARPWSQPHSHHPERAFRHPSQPAQSVGSPMRRPTTPRRRHCVDRARWWCKPHSEPVGAVPAMVTTAQPPRWETV